jgi:hypothetical protein
VICNLSFQPDLPLAGRGLTGEVPADESVATIIAILDQETDWLTAAQLLQKIGEAPTDSKKRQLREIANASQGKIISGQKGYRHIRHATPEEILHAAAWLEHQAVEMGERAKAIRRAFHQLVHTPR